MEEDNGEFLASYVYLYAFLSGCTPLIAAILPFFIAQKGGSGGRVVYILLSISAGLLFAIATLDLIPSAISIANMDATAESQESYDREMRRHGDHGNAEGAHEGHSHEHSGGDISSVPMVGLGVGYLTLLVVEQIMSASGHGHSHGGGGGQHSHVHTPTRKKKREEAMPPGKKKTVSADYTRVTIDDNLVEVEKHGGEGEKKSTLSLLAFVGLGLHSFVDGLIVAGAMQASYEVGVRVVVAIVMHKFPDGFIMSSLLVQQGSSIIDAEEKNTLFPKKAWMLLLLVSSMTPLGIFLGRIFLQDISNSVLSFVLGYGSGTFIYISASGIIPEVVESKQSVMACMLCIVGSYLSVLLLESLMHAH